MGDQYHSTGLWVDDETGQVVTSPPVEGSQLVAPGQFITPSIRAAVELAGGTIETADEPAVTEDATEPVDVEPEPVDAVETADVTPKRSRRR